MNNMNPADSTDSVVFTGQPQTRGGHVVKMAAICLL